MDRFWRLSIWISRAALAFAAFDFGVPALTAALEPVMMAWNYGIGMWTPTAITTARVQFSAYPLAMTLVALYCLTAPRRFLAGLGFIGLVSVAMLLICGLGLVTEGLSTRSLLMFERHALASSIYVIAIAIEWWRRAAVHDDHATLELQPLPSA